MYHLGELSSLGNSPVFMILSAQLNVMNQNFEKESKGVVEHFDKYSKSKLLEMLLRPIPQRDVDTWKHVLVARQIISRAPHRMGLMYCLPATIHLNSSICTLSQNEKSAIENLV